MRDVSIPVHLVGPLCTDIGENCLLDTQDTAYQLYGPMSLDNGEIYPVAGTLGTQTGNATYVGLGINQMQFLKGVANLSDELQDTAKEYAGEVSNTDKLFHAGLFRPGAPHRHELCRPEQVHSGG